MYSLESISRFVIIFKSRANLYFAKRINISFNFEAINQMLPHSYVVSYVYFKIWAEVNWICRVTDFLNAAIDRQVP
jgi:hypothetical protein